MSNLLKFFSLVMILSFSPSINAAWFFSSDNGYVKAKDFNDGKFKGFNIGAIKEYDETYLNELSETGANIVRVIVPFDFCIPNEKNILNCIYEVKTENIDKVKKLSEQLEKKKIKLVISAFFKEKSKGDFWNNKMLQTGMSDSWKLFAENVKSDKNIAAFEIYYAPDHQGLDNPYKVSEYWSIAGYNMIQSIRVVDKEHAIIFQVPNGDPQNAENLLSMEDNNIVYGFDMFYPEAITLQGVAGSYNQMLNYPLGAEFSLDPYKKGVGKAINKESLKEYLEPIKSFKDKGNAIIISSWGIVHYAPKGSGYRYIKDTLSLFDEYGFSWIYYGYRINKAFDPYIAGDTINDKARTPKASMITLLRENMLGKKDEIK